MPNDAHIWIDGQATYLIRTNGKSPIRLTTKLFLAFKIKLCPEESRWLIIDDQRFLNECGSISSGGLAKFVSIKSTGWPSNHEVETAIDTWQSIVKTTWGNYPQMLQRYNSEIALSSTAIRSQSVSQGQSTQKLPIQRASSSLSVASTNRSGGSTSTRLVASIAPQVSKAGELRNSTSTRAPLISTLVLAATVSNRSSQLQVSERKPDAALGNIPVQQAARTPSVPANQNRLHFVADGGLAMRDLLHTRVGEQDHRITLKLPNHSCAVPFTRIFIRMAMQLCDASWWRLSEEDFLSSSDFNKIFAESAQKKYQYVIPKGYAGAFSAENVNSYKRHYKGQYFQARESRQQQASTIRLPPTSHVPEAARQQMATPSRSERVAGANHGINVPKNENAGPAMFSRPYDAGAMRSGNEKHPSGLNVSRFWNRTTPDTGGVHRNAATFGPNGLKLGADGNATLV